MANTFVSFVSLVSFLVASAPLLARAQIYEAVGTRAQGMGGAFVAVADDASATWWNPAGLASGANFSSVIERDSIGDPGTPGALGPARQDTASGVAIAFPAFGLSYYRLRVNEIRPAVAASTGGGQPGRQDDGAGGVALRSLMVNKFGVTVGQSLGRHLVVASTLGLLRGGVATGSGTESSAKQALDDAGNLNSASETHPDVDLGAMLSAGSLRIGVAVKHVNEPHFGDGDAGISLDRQARAGLAIVSKGATPLTLAADLDLTRTPTVNGDVRHIAGGLEGWFAKRRVGLRTGLSGNLIGPAHPSPSAGVSLGLKTGLYLDGAATFGGDQAREGWALALRATF